MRNRFDEQLDILKHELTLMGSMCEEAIALAAQALINSDASIAQQVNAVEAEINQMERDIESLCLKLLLRQQPVAKDLRQISAALKMITDMERIGDQAADIAEIIEFLETKSPVELSIIKNMAESVIKMVTQSIDAYVNQDTRLADATVRNDDIVDAYFSKVKTDLISMIASHPDEGEYALDLLMIAKYFERIGDHAVNIANWVIFSVTGEHREYETKNINCEE